MKDIFQVFLSNSVVASGFFLLLLLTKPLTEKYFSQSWHYLALRVNALLFFFPITPVCEKIAPFLVKILPIRAKTEVILPQTELSTWFIPVENFYEIGETVGADLAMTAEEIPLNWTEIFFPLWVIGSSISLIWHCYCRIRLEKELKPLIPLENPDIHAKFEQCKLEKKINARIKLFSSHKLYSPLLVGLFRGKILFPNKKMEEKHLEYIFSHELTHYKRGDLWWKALLTPISVFFWWNPLIYYFMAQFELRLEYSCDEKVVKKASIKERKSYGLAILESIDEKKQEKMKLFGVSLRTPEQKLETRLKNMLKFSEMKTRTKVLSGVLMSAMLLGAAAPTVVNSMDNVNQTIENNTLTYKEYSINKRFSDESVAEHSVLSALKLDKIVVGDNDQSGPSLAPAPHFIELLFNRGTPLQIELLLNSPLVVTYSDDTTEEISNYNCMSSDDSTSLSGCIDRTDVTSVSFLGTDFKLPFFHTSRSLTMNWNMAPTENIAIDNNEVESADIMEQVETAEIYAGLSITPTIVETSAFLMEGPDNDEDLGEIQMLEEGSQGARIVPVDVQNDLSIAQEIFKSALFDVAMSAENPENCTVTWHGNLDKLTIQAEEGRDFSDGDVFIRLAKVRETLPPTVIDLLEEIPFSVTIILDENGAPQLRAHDVFWAEHLGLNMLEE